MWTEIDLNESEYFLKANVGRSEISRSVSSIFHIKGSKDGIRPFNNLNLTFNYLREITSEVWRKLWYWPNDRQLQISIVSRFLTKSQYFSLAVLHNKRGLQSELQQSEVCFSVKCGSVKTSTWTAFGIAFPTLIGLGLN